MIGLIDYDFLIDEERLIPNLEILKLATYFEKRNEVVKLISDLQSLDPYDEIFMRAECYKPEQLPRHKKIHFAGLVFENAYKNLKPDIIEFYPYNIRLYLDIVRDRFNRGILSPTDVQNFIESSYYRIFIDESQLPIPPTHKNRKFYIYDTDLKGDNWHNIVLNIIERKPRIIHFLHPIECQTYEQYRFLRDTGKIAKGTKAIWNFIQSKQDFYKLYQKERLTLLSECSLSSKNYLKIDGCNVFDCLNKLDIIYYCWTNQVPLKLIYNLDKSNEYWELLTLLSEWTQTPTKWNKSFWEWHGSKNTLQDIYTKFISQEPDIKRYFEQIPNQLFNGGFWEL